MDAFADASFLFAKSSAGKFASRGRLSPSNQFDEIRRLGSRAMRVQRDQACGRFWSISGRADKISMTRSGAPSAPLSVKTLRRSREKNARSGWKTFKSVRITSKGRSLGLVTAVCSASLSPRRWSIPHFKGAPAFDWIAAPTVQALCSS
jgi:hypothetical protein